ncbi:MAG: hypothetical protein IPG64_21250 [Haliea sp.]|nr:hypothetical protein [Haliea sp.]
MVTGMAIRLPPFTHAGQSVLDDAFFQALTIAEWVDLVRMDDAYLLIDNPDIPRILLPQEGEARTPTFGRVGFPVERLQRLLGLDEGPPRLRILGFRVLSACNPRGCEYFRSTSRSDGAKGGHFAPSN